MSFDLNELRAQRERVREHLAWLDRQIAQADDSATQPKPAVVPDAKATPEMVKPATVAADPQPVTRQPPSHPLTATPEEPAVHIPMEYSPGGFDSSSKVGCILTAVLLVAIFLFLLFGLPYLWPDKAEETPASETPAQIK